MSKIVTAINIMVSNPDCIGSVVKGCSGTECFFLYHKKHQWSILRLENGHYHMAYYPGNQDVKMLASIPDSSWQHEDIDCVEYTSKELGTKESLASMAELFSVVNERVYGMSDVLDDIISSDPSF